MQRHLTTVKPLMLTCFGKQQCFFFILTDLNNKHHVCIIDVLQCDDRVTFISFSRSCLF